MRLAFLLDGNGAWLGSNGARLGPDGSKEGIISIERAPRLIHSTAYVQNVENLGGRLNRYTTLFELPFLYLMTS